jgi:hypothetical protein
VRGPAAPHPAGPRTATGRFALIGPAWPTVLAERSRPATVAS